MSTPTCPVVPQQLTSRRRPAAALGHTQLAHATPEAVPVASALPGYVDDVIATLTAVPDEPDARRTG